MVTRLGRWHSPKICLSASSFSLCFSLSSFPYSFLWFVLLFTSLCYFHISCFLSILSFYSLCYSHVSFFCSFFFQFLLKLTSLFLSFLLSFHLSFFFSCSFFHSTFLSFCPLFHVFFPFNSQFFLPFHTLFPISFPIRWFLVWIQMESITWPTSIFTCYRRGRGGVGGLCRGESGHAGKEGGLGAGSQCSINQKEWHSCRPWQPSCHPYVCSPPPSSHSNRTSLVMGRVKREERGGERTLLIKHLRLIVMKCHP